MGLTALALVAAGSAAVAALRGYLFDEVDRSLAQTAERFVGPEGTQPPPDGPREPFQPGPVGPEYTYVRFSDAAGSGHWLVGDAAAVTDPPTLPDLSVSEVRALDGAAYVVASESGAARWRAVTVPTSDGSASVTAAADISGIDATVQRLILIEVAIGALVLASVGAAGWYLVRRSLRPLVDVERAAAAIAGGDLTRRAPDADRRTEVGSLGASFNAMVDAVQGALAARQASESAALESAAAATASEARMRQFVADASHELRTPLTSVRGFAELFRIGAVPPGPASQDALARIEAEAARMGLLVDDLLLLARLDQQRPLERATIDLGTLVTDAVVAARAGAPDRTLTLDVPNDGAFSVAGDRARLRQVLDNLLSNALRYAASDRPIAARVRASRLRDGTPGAVVEVVDGGPGMPPEVSGRVFERFFRADSARSRALGGSGLGLAIVRAIVEAHGGEVGVTSTVGVGSTFRVTLPLCGPGAEAVGGGDLAPEGRDRGAADQRSDDSAAEPALRA